MLLTVRACEKNLGGALNINSGAIVNHTKKEPEIFMDNLNMNEWCIEIIGTAVKTKTMTNRIFGKRLENDL